MDEVCGNAVAGYGKGVAKDCVADSDAWGWWRGAGAVLLGWARFEWVLGDAEVVDGWQGGEFLHRRRQATTITTNIEAHGLRLWRVVA